MVERGEGAILNVASTAAFQPLPGQAGYAAGKSFVLSYTRSLSGELRGTGVTVTALCPGPVDTGFGEAAGFEDPEAALPKFMWESVDAVAKCGVDALDKGRVVAIPGAANRVGAMLAHVTPKRLLVPILARQHPGLKD
jgi:short-subunit dehydrogenase